MAAQAGSPQTKGAKRMIEQVAIQLISIGGMAIGGLSFGICLGFGMWASGVRMAIATVEKTDNAKEGS
jgi:hypothetical protein